MLTNPFSPYGRLTRVRYAIAIVLLAAALLVVRRLTAGPAPAEIGSSIILTLALSLPWFCVTAQRLHDTSQDEFRALPSIALVLGYGCFASLARTTTAGPNDVAEFVTAFCGIGALIMATIVGITDPTSGPNRFGPDPRDGDAPEKAAEPQEMTAEDLEAHPTALSATGMNGV
jgi:uncharacterized membrane protein YhaH (DUF805 family)